MDGFELNKIVGAVLGTLLFIMGIGFIAEAVYHPIEGRGPGYTLPEPEGGDHGGGPAPVVVETPLAVLLASASADDGLKVAKKCVSCHNFEEGAGNKTGPALYNIVGSGAGQADYAYSGAFQDLAGSGTTWTYENLNEFLKSPKAFAQGTKMTFAGLRSDKDRANILAYLQSLSASPVPFPEPEPEPEPMEDEMADAHSDEGEAAHEDGTASH